MVECYHTMTETPLFLYFSHQPARLSVHFCFSLFVRLQQSYNLLWTPQNILIGFSRKHLVEKYYLKSAHDDWRLMIGLY